MNCISTEPPMFNPRVHAKWFIRSSPSGSTRSMSGGMGHSNRVGMGHFEPRLSWWASVRRVRWPFATIRPCGVMAVVGGGGPLRAELTSSWYKKVVFPRGQDVHFLSWPATSLTIIIHWALDDPAIDTEVQDRETRFRKPGLRTFQVV